MTESPTSPLEQARILSEALPHMQRYDEEIVVIKYGGHAMGDEDAARQFARDVVLLEQTAINPVVVHGGGPQIETMLKRLGIKSQFAAGLRVTDAATIEVVEMVLAGSINKQIVSHINQAGGKAVGLCGKDGGMVTARKISPQGGVASAIGRSRFRGRAGKSRRHGAQPDPRPRTHSGAGAGRGRKERRDLQRQRRYFRRLYRGRAQGQALAAFDRCAGRARQVEKADRTIFGRTMPAN